MKEIEAGILYIVATPIGNLKDMTYRGVEVLKRVQLIAAEDTRRARILLQAYDIDTALTSLHEHNEYRKCSRLISLLKQGKDLAYISNAGTPAISDPGYLLVRRAIENQIRVVPVPGSSAVVAALSVSGFPADSFTFDGFLPASPLKRRQYLLSVKNENRPLVLYESPHRLTSALLEAKEILGNRQIVFLREMTKIYEEILQGSAGELLEMLKGRKIKGEITLIIAPATVSETSEVRVTADEIRALYEKNKNSTDLTSKDIIRVIAEDMGISRKKVYESVFRGREELSS